MYYGWSKELFEAGKRRLAGDNGASYVAGDLANWLEDEGTEHVRGTPYHPQTQGKIERWHQTLKNRILLLRES
jgi:putative transposase